MRLIDRKYQILKKLGEGFGGSVYLARSEGKEIALKQLFIPTDDVRLSSEEVLQNFKKEFSTLTKLNHPHIVRILDFGHDVKKNLYYFTSEYIQGRNIFEATRESTVEEVEELFVEILRALSYLHSHNIYHLDLKPTNILVEETGKKTAKLIDFGLSSFWKKGVFAGSPAYMAPESLLDEPRDGRADLYSLGLTWYKCLTGENPFETDDVKQTIELQRVWSPPPISGQRPDIPSYLNLIFEKLLQKNPAERYHRADQVIRDLNWGGGHNYPLETTMTALSYLPGEGHLVGRDHEWSQLLSFFNRVFATRSDTRVCVLVSGKPGTGKSRLLKELKYHAQLQTIPIVDFGTTSPVNLTSATLLMSDNADKETIEEAHQWMSQFSPHSFLIVLSVPEQVESSEYIIKLDNFDRTKVSEYVGSVLGIDHPPHFLIDEFYSRTDGNPLLLTELLQSLMQTNQIFDSQGRWSPSLLKEVGLDFGKLQAPRTIREYCKNKFDALPETAQNLLAMIAIGQTPLPHETLMRLRYDSVSSDFRTLLRENLIRREPGQEEVKLNNPIFQEWIPKHLEASRLSTLHQKLGDLLKQNPDSQAMSWYHLGHGTGQTEERLQYLSQYADILYEKSRWLEAANTYSLIAGLETNPKHQVEVSFKKAKALFRAGKHPEALKCLEDSQAILKRERENPEHWLWIQPTFREMGSIYLKEGRLDLARESLEASRILLEQHSSNPVEEMILDNFKASLLFHEGRLNEALAISTTSHRKWQSLPDDSKKQVMNNELASMLMAQGKYAEAKKLFEERVNYCRQVGNLQKLSYALYGWAECCFFLEQYSEATRHFEECVDVSRSVRNEELLFCCYNGLGNIFYLSKKLDQSSTYYQDALELAQHCGDTNGSFAIAINLASIFHQQRDLARAHIFLKRVIDTLENLTAPSLPQLQYLVQAYMELGRIETEESQYTDARDAYRDANRIVRKYPALERFRFSSQLGLFETSFHLGRHQEVKTLLAELEKTDLSDVERKEFEQVQKRLRKLKEKTAKGLLSDE